MQTTTRTLTLCSTLGQHAKAWGLLTYTPLTNHLLNQTLKLWLLLIGSFNKEQLSTTDILALATMKNAAKCDT